MSSTADPSIVPVVVPVVIIGSRGRLGRLACELLARSPGFELVGAFGSSDDWEVDVRSRTPCTALEATRAGLGLEHGLQLLEAGARPVIATSGMSLEDGARLDLRARELGLGGLVVPNFSLGALLLQRAAELAARHFSSIEIIEMHHQGKHDAPSGTAHETARRLARARGPAEQESANSGDSRARGADHEGVRIHSVRLPGLYAHQEILLGGPGEVLTLRHDMLGPEAFGPGILAALRFAWTARGVGRGIELAV